MVQFGQVAKTAAEHGTHNLESAPVDFAHTLSAILALHPHNSLSYHDEDVGEAVAEQMHLLLEVLVRLLVKHQAIGVLGLIG
jgi:hypothetical protein